MKSMQRGFTLIELMVVIAVIGILAAIALVSLTGVQRSARDSQRKSDLSTYRTALERYYADNQSYPGSVATGDTSGTDTTGTGAAGIFVDGSSVLRTPTAYLPGTLRDPLSTVACKASTAGAAVQCTYKYKANATTNTATTYVLYAWLENPTATGGIFSLNSSGSTAFGTTEPAAP